MRQLIAIPFSLPLLLAAPLIAQPTIGGGTCNSALFNGAYSVTLSGRHINSSGTFTGVFQANGSASFDGQNKVTLTLTSNTNQASGMQLNWSGSYSVQANCAGTISINSGGSVTFNILLFNGGSAFLLTGADANYDYSGNGSAQPASCLANLLTGPYTLNASGFALTGTGVSGPADLTGLLQFDGQSVVTATLYSAALGAAPTAKTYTGTYILSTSCVGSATLSDSTSNVYSLGFSVTGLNKTNVTNLDVTLARNSTFLLSGAAHTLTSTTSPTCSASLLNGTYSLTLTGRAISAGGLAGSFQGGGTATFDGNSKVTFAGTANTNLSSGTQFSYSGTYTLSSNCSGAVTLASGSTATFGLVAYNGGKQFNLAGSDAMYLYAGNGSSTRPATCATPTLSGAYTYDTTGFTESGTVQNGAGNEAGLLQFDGQGNLTATYTAYSSSGSPSSLTATGTYSVTASCLATATLKDSNGVSNALSFIVQGNNGETLNLLQSNPQFVTTGTAHSTFSNPSQSIGNVASYAVSSTPPGSVFVLFGQGLATRAVGAATVPLPTTLLTTSVTVNGMPASLFYVSDGQIDAQMPQEIPGGSIASVVVKNGNTTSNAAAVYVPATGTPGISVYGNNRAVVVDKNGVNSPEAPATVGEEVVVYFTGGGPVQAAGSLKTGAPAPAGLSPVTGANSITVGGVSATVVYMGLTPLSIGLYQANFVVPQLAKGVYPLVITIAGQQSNNPVMNVSN